MDYPATGQGNQAGDGRGIPAVAPCRSCPGPPSRAAAARALLEGLADFSPHPTKTRGQAHRRRRRRPSLRPLPGRVLSRWRRSAARTSRASNSRPPTSRPTETSTAHRVSIDAPTPALGHPPGTSPLQPLPTGERSAAQRLRLPRQLLACHPAPSLEGVDHWSRRTRFATHQHRGDLPCVAAASFT
jgi:hypothetical protein